MSLYTGKQLSLEEAKEYNRKISEFRSKPGSHGCVNTRACEHCGILVTDSICLCIGYFKCPKCGEQNGTDYSKLPNSFSAFEIIGGNTINLTGTGIFRLPEQNTYYPYV